MKTKITFYKIKDMKTGLYSCGGNHPTFNHRGKAWNNIAHVKSHLMGVKKNDEQQLKHSWTSATYKPVEMKTWVVEEFLFVQKEFKEIPIAELIISAGLF